MDSIRPIFFALALVTLYIVTSAAQASLSVSGKYTLRLEHIENSPRLNYSNSGKLLGSRLEFKLNYSWDRVYFVGELQDARVFLDDEETPLGTDDVNALEPIQAYIGKRWGEKNQHDLKVGRFTLDIGNRRLVARPRFRNTRNTLTGLYLDYHSDALRTQTLLTMPDYRFPTARDELDSNSAELDKFYVKNVFGGVNVSTTIIQDATIEGYYFGLTERDQPSLATQDRLLHTIGMRWVYEPVSRPIEVEFEGAYQFGKAHPSKRENRSVRQDVSAYFGYVSFAYTTTDSLRSKYVLELNYASGDRDNQDNRYNRFDPLFGVRRAEFNATNLYGVFSRKNHMSFGIGWHVKPKDNVQGYINYRPNWLASQNDSIPSINIRSENGKRFVGHQFEGRLRLGLAESIRLELGGIVLIKGEVFDTYHTDNTRYMYSELSYAF